MITHVEAYKAHCNAIIGQTADEVDENHDIVKRYMKQQVKVEKLLKLYRLSYDYEISMCRELDTDYNMSLQRQRNDEIDELEEELK